MNNITNNSNLNINEPSSSSTSNNKKTDLINKLKRQYVDRSGEASSSFVEQSIEQISNLDRVPKIPYLNVDVLKAKLKPGDIFLSYYPDSSDKIAGAIRTGQSVIKRFVPSSTSQSDNFIHASIYVGDGKMSEATGEGVRTTDLDGERFKLKTGESNSFLVVRPRNQAMAREACRIAKELAVEDPDQTANFPYSYKQALFSGLNNSQLKEEGVIRYLIGSAYTIFQLSPEDKEGVKDLFCSYFIAWSCHVGESLEVLDRINSVLPEVDRIKFPDISEIEKSQRGKVLKEWAKDVVSKHFDLFTQYIDLDLDPKFTTPQRLYGFINDHPELFKQKMMIVAPQKETEMTEF